MDKGKFAVYRTVEVNIDAIIDRLGKGITGKEKHHDMWHAIPESFIGSTPTQLINHHRSHRTSLNQKLLVIIDRQDLEAEGLLVVNLNFRGSVDALRQKTFFAGDFVPSVDVGNTAWEETLANATLPLYPRRRFAVFADPGFHPRYLMTEVLNRMNVGLNNRRADTGTIFANWASAPGDDVAETTRFWRENAREREWDAGHFVLVKEDAWDKGKAVVISLEEGLDKARETMLDVKRIGEVLVWLYVGLVTLDEVRETNVDDQGGARPLESLWRLSG